MTDLDRALSWLSRQHSNYVDIIVAAYRAEKERADKAEADCARVRRETVEAVKKVGKRSEECFDMKWEPAYLIKESKLDAIAEGGEG